MKELLDKLSSYNLFNYLLPGTIFVAAAQRISAHTFKDENIVVELFLYYFIGMVISRIGSLTIEPALKKVKFIKFAPYKEFVRTSLKDPKIDILSEQNNTYRTLCAVFLSLGILKLYDVAVVWRPRTTRALSLSACSASSHSPTENKPSTSANASKQLRRTEILAGPHSLPQRRRRRLHDH